jgi:hypothetical protein
LAGGYPADRDLLLLNSVDQLEIFLDSRVTPQPDSPDLKILDDIE